MKNRRQTRASGATICIFIGAIFALVLFNLVLGYALADTKETRQIEFVDENVLTDGAVYRIIGAEPKKDICLVRVEKQMQERIDQYNLVDTEAVILLPNSEYPVAVEDFWHGNVPEFTCEPYDDLTVK